MLWKGPKSVTDTLLLSTATFISPVLLLKKLSTEAFF